MLNVLDATSMAAQHDTDTPHRTRRKRSIYETRANGLTQIADLSDPLCAGVASTAFGPHSTGSGAPQHIKTKERGCKSKRSPTFTTSLSWAVIGRLAFSSWLMHPALRPVDSYPAQRRFIVNGRQCIRIHDRQRLLSVVPETDMGELIYRYPYRHNRRGSELLSLPSLGKDNSFGERGATSIPPRAPNYVVKYDNEISKDERVAHIEPTLPGKSEPLYDWDITLKSFNMDLHNLAMEDPVRAHDAVEIMLGLYTKDPDSRLTVRPDATCFTTVMDGYIQAGKLHQAQGVLDQMETLAADDLASLQNDTVVSVSPFAPTEYTYILMIQAWANDYREDYTGVSAEKAVAILRRMQTMVAQGAISLGPGRSSMNGDTPMPMITNGLVKAWTMVVEGWCKRSGIARQAMQRAEELLLEMESDDGPLIGRPNVVTYTCYIGGLSRCKRNDLARKAEEVLDRMEQNGIEPDSVAYTSVINCWAKAVSRRERGIAAKRAMCLLEDMERMYITNKMYNVKPSIITYSAVVAAIGNSLDPAAPQLAEDVIKRMQKLQESGAIANLRPGTSIYNTVIYALSRAPVSNRLRYAKRAEQILDEMTLRAQNGEKDVQPDVRTWAAVLRAWAHSKQPDAAEHAQRVLDKMEYRYKKGMSSVRPNFVCCTTVMGAWGQSQSENALDNMERILHWMEQSYEETLEPDIRPNTVSYITCIDALVQKNEPDAAQRAQATVDRMIQLYAKGLGHVRPTRTVLNVLIHAWSRSKDKGAAQNAEKIFQWMEAQSQAGDDLVRPDEVSLCAVLNAWANQAENGGAQRAQQIWEHAESVSVHGFGFRPTVAMANIVIKAIARSKDPDAASKAENMLLRLEDDYQSGKSHLRPDVATYSSVINACAYCIGDTTKRSIALEIALRTFYKLCELEDEPANNITYGTVFKAIQNLMPISEERENLVRDLFDQCCDEGFVDSFVLSQVRFASPELYRELVEGPCGLGGNDAQTKYGIDAVLKNIPTEWAANVIE